MIYMVDCDPRIREPEDPTAQAQRADSPTRRYTRIIRQGLLNCGVDPDMCDKLPQWLPPDSNIWNDAQRGFKDVHSDIRIFPAFPHDGHSCMNLIDPSMVPYTRHFI